MKIVGTEEEIRTFQAIAGRGKLDEMMDVTTISYDGDKRCTVSFLDKEIEFVAE